MEKENAQKKSAKTYTALSCLANILNHLGKKNSPEDLIEEYKLSDAEIQWDDFRKIAKKNNIKTELLHLSESELRETPVPAIVRFHDGSYAVLGINTDEAVFILDPKQSKSLAISRKLFLDIWTGEILVFTSKLDWRRFSRKYHLKWFYEIILHYKRFFGEVILASFFIQLMGLVTPLCTQVVIDKVIGNKGLSTLTVLGIALVFFAIFQSVMGALRTYVLNHTTNKLDAILGTRLFRHLISLPLPYYEQRRVGDTLMRVGALNSIRQFLTGTTLTTFLDLFFSIIFLAFMFYYSIPLSLLVLLIVPLYLLENLWAMPIFRRKIEAVWRTGAANNAFLVESITGIHTVKSLAVEPQFHHRWEKLLSNYARTTFSQNSFSIMINTSTQLIQRVILLGILWYGGRMVMNGEFTLGQLIAFQMIAGQAITPLTNIFSIWPSVQQTGLALEQIGDILNTRIEPILNDANLNKTDKLQGKITLKDVSFRYRLDLPLALEGINLEIAAGEKIGIVGRSGSGKSTLTSLIQKLYLPENGEILLDDEDIMQLDYSGLRKNIGVVMQENYLFNASIRDNIAISYPTASMDQVIQAAKIAEAHSFILELPEGYDTKVGERGASLSGGQRQRIAIARAILGNPSILIFDEATSALDNETERNVMKNLELMGKDRTILIIAHRLSTVENCDKIIVVDKGKIIQTGTHAELLQCSGIYQNLYQGVEE